MKLQSLLEVETVAAQMVGRFAGPETVGHKAALIVRAARALVDTGVVSQEEARALFVPGRVEVLGKHTDYAGGRSIVAALERGFCMVVHPRTDDQVRIMAVEMGDYVDCVLTPELEVPQDGWTNYPMTVVRRLARNFGATLQGQKSPFSATCLQRPA